MEEFENFESFFKSLDTEKLEKGTFRPLKENTILNFDIEIPIDQDKVQAMIGSPVSDKFNFENSIFKNKCKIKSHSIDFLGGIAVGYRAYQTVQAYRKFR